MSNKKDVQALPTSVNRAEIELKRGIVRDENGKIIRSEEWKKERKEALTHKLELLSERVKSVKKELKNL